MKNTFLFPILLCCCVVATAQDRYVDGIAGSNGNSGTSPAQAWRTIQKACNAAPPGTTIWIKGGTYQEQLSMNVSGAPSNYITFTTIDATPVIVDGGNTNTQTELLNISGQHYIKIIGLHFAHATGNFSKGVVLRNGADHIEIRNCQFYDIHFSDNPAASPVGKNANPLLVYNQSASDACSDIVFDGNEIYNCRTGVSEACTMNGNVDGFDITNNLVHDITNIGIDAAGGYGVCPDPTKDAARNGLIAHNIVYNCVSTVAVSAGIYIDGGQNIRVEYNVCHDNGRGFEIGCEQQGHVSHGIILLNNLCYHNREAGIGIGGYNFPITGKVSNCTVRNNTCYDNAFTNNGDGELLVEYAENCTIEQNVFYATNAAKWLVVTRLNAVGINLRYNLYYHVSGAANAKVDWNGTVYTNYYNYQIATGQDAQSPFSDPVFADVNIPDFQLNSGSPAINSGCPTFAPLPGETDYLGNIRVNEGRVDIGAYENTSPLAVEYASPLNAFYVSEGICLQWSTASEWNLARFEVERSGDGLSFNSIATVHLPVRRNAYNFVDRNPMDGHNYYRLRQIDRDGSITLSLLVAIKWQRPAIRIWPNLAREFVWVEETDDVSKVVLHDACGRIVRIFEAPVTRIELVGMPCGLYWLVLVGINGKHIDKKYLLLH